MDDDQPSFFRYVNGKATNISRGRRRNAARKDLSASFRSKSLPSTIRSQSEPPSVEQKPTLPSFAEFLNQVSAMPLPVSADPRARTLAPLQNVSHASMSVDAASPRSKPHTPSPDLEVTEQWSDSTSPSSPQSSVLPAPGSPGEQANPTLNSNTENQNLLQYRAIAALQMIDLNRVHALTMVDLAKHYTVAEMLHNSNIWQRANNRPELNSMKVSNKLRKSLERVARYTDRTPADVRKEIDEAKAANGTYDRQVQLATQAYVRSRAANKEAAQSAEARR